MPRKDPTPKAATPWDTAVVAVLRDLREQAGISGREVARRAGMSNNRVAIILRGESPPPTLGEVHAMATALGTDVLAIVRQARDGA